MWNDVRSSTTDYKIGKVQVSWYKLGIRHAHVRDRAESMMETIMSYQA